ncbi:MAG: hypothetical protein HS116_01670 [Planctomycetes bacterium]|nr:hypothetical protein [Planctomycetota bacterium]
MNEQRNTHILTPDALHRRMLLLRNLARALAIGASIWGVICLIFIFAGGLLAIIILTPAYLMTAGYFWRAWGNPSLEWRRTIWGFSFFIQGALAALWLFDSSVLFQNWFGQCAMVWWVISASISLGAAFLEPKL